MSWRKYFKMANTTGQLSPVSGHISGKTGWNKSDPSFRNYGGMLPEVYMGHPNRIERYTQWEAMDQDAECSAALDIIAEFCTQTNIETGNPFNVNYLENPTETESSLIKKQLKIYIKI